MALTRVRAVGPLRLRRNWGVAGRSIASVPNHSAAGVRQSRFRSLAINLCSQITAPKTTAATATTRTSPIQGLSGKNRGTNKSKMLNAPNTIHGPRFTASF